MTQMHSTNVMRIREIKKRKKSTKKNSQETVWEQVNFC